MLCSTYFKSAVTVCIGAEAFDTTIFGEGRGMIWLDNVQCVGSESHLLNCLVNSSRINPCLHIQDAGVRCLPGTTGKGMIYVQ